MAFGQAAAAGGGLSINTGSANSLFGSNSTGQNKGGLFGSTYQSQQSSGLFGSQSQPGGGIFGSSTTVQSNSGAFGTQPSQAPNSGTGVFGTQPASLFGGGTQQPAAQSGLFGRTQAQPQQGGGLFGLPTQSRQGVGLFGATQPANASSQSQPSQTGGLLGSSTTQFQPNQAGSLFGVSNAQPQQQQPGGGLFGGLGLSGNQPQQQTVEQPKPSFFSGVGLGSLQQGPQFQSSGMPFGGQQAQPAIPGVTIDLSNIRTTTRFTDLHESLQKELEQLDGMILAQMNCYKQCQAMIPSHAEKLGYLPNDVDHVTRRLETVKESQVNDAQVIERVRATVKDDSEDAKLAFAEVDNERLQPQYRTKSLWSVGLGVGSSAYLSGAGLVDFGALAGGFGAEQGHAAELRNLVAFFSNRADHMTQTINTYRHTLSEIESHVRTVEARTGQEIQHFVSTRELHGSQSSAEDQIRELAVVLRDFENGILGVAGKVGAAREGMQRLLLDTADGGADGLNGYGHNGTRHGSY